MQPSAAVISFSPLHKDARVQRQIRALGQICKVTAIGLTDPHIDGVSFVDVSTKRQTFLRIAFGACEKISRACLLKAGFFEAAYRLQGRVQRAAKRLKDHDFALIVANDISALPLALTYRGQAKILFDAHEYAPRQYETWFLWQFFLQKYTEYLCRTRIPHVDAMTTVGPTIAQEYAQEFGITPSIVQSAPRYHAILYQPRDEEVIRMVHVGSALPYRRLETMIEAMAQLDERFRLDFMLVLGDSGYLARLKKLASNDQRIAFVPPVAPDDIVERISAYDVGLCTYSPHSFSARYALPNKFFDSVQARLCIAIGPLPEMQRLVEQYDCGVVAADFTPMALARTLNNLDRQRVEACRRAAEIAAFDLCYERSAEVLQDTVLGLLGPRGEIAGKP